MIRIDYDIFCFDRVLSVEVQAQDKEKALQIIDASYYEWHESDTCDCCEEYILHQLEQNNIEYKHIDG